MAYGVARDSRENRIGGLSFIEQKFMPFGEGLAPTTGIRPAKGFTNHEQTDDSGLIYMQARFYAPWFGRFLSPDPKLDQHFQDTQTWNIYSYCANNPTMRIDPDGMEWGKWDRFLDAVADGAAAVHTGLQKVPVLGAAYSAGARLGEAISGERVNANGTTTQLSLDQRSTAAFQGTVGMAPLVVGGGVQMALPGGIPIPTGSTVTPGGAVVLTTVTANAGNVAGALAVPAVMAANNGPGSGSGRNEQSEGTKGGRSQSDPQRNGTPGNNQAQNKQFRDATRGLTKSEQQQLHHEISGQNHTYKELKQMAQEIIDARKK